MGTLVTSPSLKDSRGILDSYSDPRSKDDSTVFPLDGVELDSISNEALQRLIHQAPIIHELQKMDVVRLSKTLAMKCGNNVLEFALTAQ